VSRAITIVNTLRAQGKAVEAVGRADGVKTVLPPGQKLVDITLMTHIPDKFVLGSREGAMERDGQLDHAEIGAEVSAVFGKLGDEFVADFLGQLLQLRQGQFFEVDGFVHHVQVSAHSLSFGL